jgi:hypothetical protein
MAVLLVFVSSRMWTAVYYWQRGTLHSAWSDIRGCCWWNSTPNGHQFPLDGGSWWATGGWFIGLVLWWGSPPGRRSPHSSTLLYSQVRQITVPWCSRHSSRWEVKAVTLWWHVRGSTYHWSWNEVDLTYYFTYFYHWGKSPLYQLEVCWMCCRTAVEVLMGIKVVVKL